MGAGLCWAKEKSFEGVRKHREGDVYNSTYIDPDTKELNIYLAYLPRNVLEAEVPLYTTFSRDCIIP